MINVCVVREGNITAQLSKTELSQSNIMKYATKGEDKDENKYKFSWSDNIIGSFVKRNLGIIIVLMVLMITLSLVSDVFLTSQNLITVLKQISHNMCLALGMTLIIILGGIDLSVGALVAMTGTLCAGFIVLQDMQSGSAICVTMLLGIFCRII